MTRVTWCKLKSESAITWTSWVLPRGWSQKTVKRQQTHTPNVFVELHWTREWFNHKGYTCFAITMFFFSKSPPFPLWFDTVVSWRHHMLRDSVFSPPSCRVHLHLSINTECWTLWWHCMKILLRFPIIKEVKRTSYSSGPAVLHVYYLRVLVCIGKLSPIFWYFLVA